MVTAAVDSAGATVDFSLPMIEDDCGATLNINRNPGEFFLCGTNSVTYFAEDAGGNTSAVCNFTITINCPEVACCANENDFNSRVDAGFISRVDSATLLVSPVDLGPCHVVTYDWGDNSDVVQAGGCTLLEHSYASPGTYTICMTVQELDDDAFYLF